MNGMRPTLEMSQQRRWIVVIGVMTGMAIASLEATVVGTAMPTVIASLGGINHYSWVFSAYLVTSFYAAVMSYSRIRPSGTTTGWSRCSTLTTTNAC